MTHFIGDATAWPHPGGETFGVPTDFPSAYKFNALASDTITKLQMRVRGFSDYTALDLAIYADSSGAPGALLGYGTAVNPSIASDLSAWVDATLGSSVAVTSGQPYWLVAQPHGGFVYANFNYLGPPIGWFSPDLSGATPPPNPYGTGTLSTIDPPGIRGVNAGASVVIGDSGSYPNPFGSIGFVDDGYAEGYKFTASATGTIGTLRAWILDDSTFTTLNLLVYADSGGSPGALIDYGTCPAVTPGAGDPLWVETGVVSIPVVSGTDYWLAWQPQGGYIDMYLGDDPGQVAFGTSSTSPTPFDPLPADFSDDTHVPGFEGVSAVTNTDLTGTSASDSDAYGFLIEEVGPRITDTFEERWASGEHIGDARPELRVEVREGRFNRRYDHWFDDGYPVGATIGTSDRRRPWQAFWEPTEPYVEIPSVRSVELAKTFDEKGVATATIILDNIAYLAEGGGHHSIHRGYLSPLRGYVADGRTRLTDERGDDVNENEWFGKLNRKRQITVHEGYGDEMIKTFTGLIDDVDDTSNPAVITLTARSFGQVLTDEEFFGWNIDKDLRDPVVFIDEDDADNITKGGYDPSASSTGGSFPADNVNDGDSDTYWRSNDHSGAGNTEWVEVKLAQGRYEDFWLGTKYPNLDAYVSIFAKPLADGTAPSADGTPLTPNAWVDNGSGTVPGAFGGIPYVHLISSSNTTTQIRDLPASYKVGADSLLRVSFRALYDTGGAVYRAGARSLYSRKRTLVAEAGAAKWIRVKDISDVVKVVLRWAGFKEWEVESTGARLGKRVLANRGMKYMDLIDLLKDGVGFEFHVADPTDADDSIGVPVFRKSHVVADDIDTVFTVTDGSDPDDGNPHLLTSVDVKEGDENRAYIIRVRGRTAKTGDTLGGDTTKRIMYVYRPPWSGLDSAGVIRHVVHTDHLYTRADDVKFAAWYLALQESLESVAVGVQIPAFPGIDLDDIFILEDLGTGLTTRLQVRERRSTSTAGEDAQWTMTMAGAITDTPDVQAILALIRGSIRDA